MKYLAMCLVCIAALAVGSVEAKAQCFGNQVVLSNGFHSSFFAPQAVVVNRGFGVNAFAFNSGFNNAVVLNRGFNSRAVIVNRGFGRNAVVVRQRAFRPTVVVSPFVTRQRVLVFH